MHNKIGSEVDVAYDKLLKKITTPEIPEAITINKAGTEFWVGSNKN